MGRNVPKYLLSLRNTDFYIMHNMPQPSVKRCFVCIAASFSVKYSEIDKFPKTGVSVHSGT